jgi:predicted MPP superfamily phosphohydrolase
LLSLLLLLGLCCGHATLMVGWHNWFYGLPLPRHSGRYIHLSFFLLTLAGPVALILLLGIDPIGWLEQTWSSHRDWVHGLLLGYLALCLVAGLGVLPGVTLARLLRPRPAAETAVQSRVVDVAKWLGYRPVGHGKSLASMNLPGNEVFSVELVERTLCLPRVPAAWDGLSIVHFSDLHLCGAPDRHYHRMVMQLVSEWQPDIVALTGDIADSLHHQGWIIPVLGWLRWRTAAFAILGNHDYWYEPRIIRRQLGKLGFTYLGNGWRQIEVRGEPLVVIGNETPWAWPVPDLSNCPTEPFRLCLSHTPDNIRWARRQHVDLMLSGHVHGGQIRFPVLGSLLVPSRFGRRYDCGTFDEAPTLLHVSRGIGGEHPVRYRCRPEVTRLILRSGKGGSP